MTRWWRRRPRTWYVAIRVHERDLVHLLLLAELVRSDPAPGRDRIAHIRVTARGRDAAVRAARRVAIAAGVLPAAGGAPSRRDPR